MSKSLRLSARILSTGGLLTALLWTANLARPQQSAPEPVVPGASGPYAAASIQGDTRLTRVAQQIPQLLASKDWDTLAHALQTLLDAPRGVLLHERNQDATGRAYVHWRSPHVLVNAVLSKLSNEALKVYNDHYAGTANDLLTQARKKNDVRLLADVAERYLYTPAGPKALALLAAEQVEAGQLVPAALCYERLLTHPRADLKAFAFYQAAVVFHKVGDKEHAEVAWRRLQNRLGQNTLSIDGQKLTARQIKSELDRIPPLPTTARGDWPLFLGNATRNAQIKGGRPDLGKALWQRPTLLDRLDENGPADRGAEFKPFLDRALQRRLDDVRAPVLPGAFPLAVGDKVIYRTYAGLTAVYATEVKDRQGQVEGKSGEVYWKSTDLDGSPGMLFSDGALIPTMQTWVQTYERLGASALFFENAMTGTLSADGRFVYAIDDLAIPPTAGKQVNNPKLDPLMQQNSLQAFSLYSGKIELRLGNSWQKDDPFNGSHWIGPPLPLGGTIYALNETNAGMLRLVCIDPTKRGGKVLSVQALAGVQDRFASSVLRRTQPAHLAYRDGVLVCPTNAGAVLAVDPATQALLWGYTYREGKRIAPRPRFGKPMSPEPLPQPQWRNTAPVIVGSKIIITAPDEGSIHCLNLRDGALVWRTAKDADDLYLAGVQGNAVVLVGKTACRALDLASGKELWRLETGVPSGMGVASGSTYYLPLRSTVAAKRPAVCAIDVGKGQIVRFLTAGKEGPGNLLFHAGQLIAQGPTTVTAYPLRREDRE